MKPALMKCMECGTRATLPLRTPQTPPTATPPKVVTPVRRASTTSTEISRSARTLESTESTTDTVVESSQVTSTSAELDKSLITATCECGATLRVKAEWAGRHRKCRKCSLPVLIPLVEDATAGLEIAQLKHCVDAAIRKLPSQPEITLKKTLAKLKLGKLKQQLQEQNPLDQAEAQRRRMAILELGSSHDIRAFELIAPCENDRWEHVRSGVALALGILADPRGLPILLRYLCDQSVEVVHEAIKALRNSESEQTVRPLLRLGLVNPNLKLYVSDAIAQIGVSAVPVLLDVVQHRDRGMLLDAVIMLGKIGHESAVPTLLNTIDHATGPTRAFTIESLGRIADKRAVTKLIEQLQTDDEILQLNAIVALGKIRDPRALRALLPFLEHADLDLQKRAIDALGEIADPRVVPAFLKLLSEAHENLKPSVVEALTKIGDSSAVDALLPLLEESPPELQAKILLCVKKAKTGTAVPVLLSLLDHKKPLIRRHAVDALGEIAQPNTWEIVSGLVGRDASFEVRASAVKALGKIGNKQALPILEKALRDESAVRCGAVIALGCLGDRGACPALVAMLRDSAPEVRYHAVVALGKLEAKSAIPPIQALLEDPDPMVQRGAEKTLEELGAGPPSIPFSKRLSKLAGNLLPDAVAGMLPGKSLLAGLGAVAALVIGGIFFSSSSSPIRASAPVTQQGQVGSLIAIGDSNQVAMTRTRGEFEVWDAESGQLLKSTRLETPGELVAVGSRPAVFQAALGRITPWNFETSDSMTGTPPLSLPGGVAELHISTNGKTALVRNREGTFTWDLDSKKKLVDISAMPRSQIALSGDGQSVVALTPDLKHLQWFSSNEEAAAATVDLNIAGVRTPVLNPDGDRCVLLTPQGVAVINRSTSEVQEITGTSGLSFCRFADAEHLVAARGDAVVWITLSSKQVVQWPVSEAEISITQVVPSRTGKRVIVAAEEKRSFWIVDTTTGTSKEIK